MVKDKSFYRSLLIVAIPAAFQSLISLSVNMLDNVMVGSLGDVSLAAVSLANQATALLTFFINGIAGGSAVLVSQYWGKKDFAHIREIFAVILRFAFISITLISLVMFCFPRAVMRVFTPDPEMIAAGAQYVRIICFSYIFYALANICVFLTWFCVQDGSRYAWFLYPLFGLGIPLVIHSVFDKYPTAPCLLLSPSSHGAVFSC